MVLHAWNSVRANGNNILWWCDIWTIPLVCASVLLLCIFFVKYTKDERSWKLLRWYLFQIHRASILSIHGFSLVLYKQHGPHSWSPLWKIDKNFKNFLNTLLAVEQAHLTGLPTIIVWKMSFWCDFVKNMVNPVRGRNPGTSNAFKISSF